MKFKTKEVQVDVGLIDTRGMLHGGPYIHGHEGPPTLSITEPGGKNYTMTHAEFRNFFEPADEDALAFWTGIEERAAHAAKAERQPYAPPFGPETLEYEMRGGPGMDPGEVQRMKVKVIPPKPPKDQP